MTDGGGMGYGGGGYGGYSGCETPELSLFLTHLYTYSLVLHFAVEAGTCFGVEDIDYMQWMTQRGVDIVCLNAYTS